MLPLTGAISPKRTLPVPPPDPYQHHPELRGQILPAAESFFRNIDLAEIDRRVIADGQPADWRTPCDQREAQRKAWLNGRFERDLWVFGYGSLMWDPSIEFVEVRRARTDGYGRSFCIWDEGGRGSRDRPGLMLAMDAGDGCEGLAFRIAARQTEHETFVLFRREMIVDVYHPVWLTLDTAQGPIEALSFAANHASDKVRPGIPLPEQACMIDGAEGMLGRNLDYLQSTGAHLDLMNIADPYIDALLAQTAQLRPGSAPADGG